MSWRFVAKLCADPWAWWRFVVKLIEFWTHFKHRPSSDEDLQQNFLSLQHTSNMEQFWRTWWPHLNAERSWDNCLNMEGHKMEQMTPGWKCREWSAINSETSGPMLDAFVFKVQIPLSSLSSSSLWHTTMEPPSGLWIQLCCVHCDNCMIHMFVFKGHKATWNQDLTWADTFQTVAETFEFVMLVSNLGFIDHWTPTENLHPQTHAALQPWTALILNAHRVQCMQDACRLCAAWHQVEQTWIECCERQWSHEGQKQSTHQDWVTLKHTEKVIGHAHACRML